MKRTPIQVADFFQPVRPDVLDQLPEGLDRDLLLAELRNAFHSEAAVGQLTVDPRRIAVELFARGYSPETTRWLLREARIGAAVALVPD